MWAVADTHNDALMHLDDNRPGLQDSRQINLPGLVRGGAALICFAVFTGPKPYPGQPLIDGLRAADRFWRMAEHHAEDLFPVCAMADYRQARKDEKIGVMLTIEGGGVLQGDIAVLRLFHRLGARMFSLTWTNDNELGCGIGAQNDTGITDLGFAAIAQCNSLNMLVDVSHLSDKGFYQALEASASPIIASHSNARALTPQVKRNLTDDMLREIGRAGGYVGANFYSTFLNENPEQASIDDVVRHIEYMANLAGVHSIGIGSDFDGISLWPPELESCASYQALGQALEKRGWAQRDIAGVMGENFLRVFQAVCG